MRYLYISMLALAITGCSVAPEPCLDIEDKYWIPLSVELESCTEDASYTVWDFGDGTGWSGEKVNKRFLTEGNYTVSLTVYSDDGRDSKTTSQEVFAGWKYVDKIVIDSLNTEASDSVYMTIDGVRSNETIWRTQVEFPLTFTWPGTMKLTETKSRFQLIGVGSTGILEEEYVYQADGYENPLVFQSSYGDFTFHWYDNDN